MATFTNAYYLPPGTTKKSLTNAYYLPPGTDKKLGYPLHPTWPPISVPPSVPSSIRQISPSVLNTTASRESNPRTVNYAAEGTLIPIAYGRVQVGARIFAVGILNNFWYIGCIWCLGEVQQIEKICNSENLIPATDCHYFLGTTTQTADGWLMSAIPGYDDDLVIRDEGGSPTVGICYSVVKFPVSNTFPRLVATIQGRKLRYVEDLGGGNYQINPTPTYTANPARFILDLAYAPELNGVYDLDLESFQKAQLFCNNILSDGTYRYRAGVLIDRAASLTNWLDTLREYCGCFITTNESGQLKLILNTSVTLSTTPIITDNDIIENSLVLSRLSTANAPTVVRVSYTAITGTDGVELTTWKDDDVVIKHPNIANLPWRETRLRLEGIQSYAQAYREAVQYFNTKYLVDLEATWDQFDEAIQYEVGDVVRVTHSIGLTQKPFRITNIVAVTPGRWRITAQEYDPAIYNSDTSLDPTFPDTSLPDPFNPPAPINLTSTEEIYQVYTGIYSSRLRLAWELPDYAYSSSVNVQVKGGYNLEQTNLHENLISFSSTPTAWQKVGGTANLTLEQTGVTSPVNSTGVLYSETDTVDPVIHQVLCNVPDNTFRRNQTYTMQWVFKPQDRTRFVFSAASWYFDVTLGTYAESGVVYLYFDSSAVNKIVAFNSGNQTGNEGWAAHGSRYEDLGDGWYLVEGVFTCGARDFFSRLQILIVEQSTGPTWTSLYVGSSLVKPCYIAYAACIPGSVMGALIYKETWLRNLIDWCQDLSRWDYTTATLQLAVTDVINPINRKGVLLQENSGLNAQWIQHARTDIHPKTLHYSNWHRFFVVVKPNHKNRVRVIFYGQNEDNSDQAYIDFHFDLVALTTDYVLGNTPTNEFAYSTAAIIALDDGWYRLEGIFRSGKIVFKSYMMIAATQSDNSWTTFYTGNVEVYPFYVAGAWLYYSATFITEHTITYQDYLDNLYRPTGPTSGEYILYGDYSGVWDPNMISWEGSTSTSQELVAFPIPESGPNHNYTVEARNISSVGATSDPTIIEASVLGKWLIPGNVATASAVRISADSAKITWTPAVDIDIWRYEIREGTDWATATFVSLVDGLTYTVTGLTSGTYSWLIKAIDSIRQESEIAAATNVVPMDPPLPPATIKALEVGGTVYLNWDASSSSYVSAYEIRWGADDGTWESAEVIDRLNSLQINTNIAPPGHWRYWVKSIDLAGTYSTNATNVDVDVSLDAAAFLLGTFSIRDPRSVVDVYSYWFRHEGWGQQFTVLDADQFFTGASSNWTSSGSVTWGSGFVTLASGAQIVSNDRIPFHSYDFYRVAVAARYVTVGGQVQFGWVGYLANGTTPVSPTGTAVTYPFHDHGGTCALLTVDKTCYGYTEGFGATVGTTGQGTLENPGQMHPNVVYVSPTFRAVGGSIRLEFDEVAERGPNQLRYITDHNQAAGTLWSSIMSTYTQPLAVYTGLNDPSASEWLSQTIDFGLLLTGTWTASFSIVDLQNVSVEQLELSTDGLSWNVYTSMTAKTAARYARIRVIGDSTDVFIISLNSAFISVNAIPKIENGTGTTSAIAPVGKLTVVLQNTYAAVKAIHVTASGRPYPMTAVVDNIRTDLSPLEFDVWTFNSTTGLPVSADFSYTFEGV